MSSDTQEDERDDGSTRRVNISIYPDLHDDCTDFARDHGKSFSQLVRDSLIKEINPTESDSVASQQRQVVERLDGMEEGLDDIQQSIDEVQDWLAELSKTPGMDIDVVADDIEAILESADGSLTAAEIVEHAQHPPHQVKRALEDLHQEFTIERSNTQAETDGLRWRLITENE